jgi:hypothetical protein
MNDRWTIRAATFLFLVQPLAIGAAHALSPRFAYVANNQDDTVSIFSIQQSNRSRMVPSPFNLKVNSTDFGGIHLHRLRITASIRTV